MPTSRYIVALTGGIGSGKSTVAGMFGQFGVARIDTDAISHALTGPGGQAIEGISRVFGHGVVTSNMALDRASMRKKVFEDERARALLEDILHPMIHAEVIRAIESETVAKAPYMLLEVPLLFETMGYRRMAQRTLVVDCPIGMQQQRVVHRSGLSIQEVDKILHKQISRSQRLQLADDVISNCRDIAALQPQVDCLHLRYESMAKTKR